MNLITLLCKRFVAAVSAIVVLASVANLVNDSHFIVAEGALTDDSGEMMAAVKLMQRSQASMPNVAFLIGPLQARHFDQSSSRKTIERPLTSCVQQSYNHLPKYRSLTSIRMSSVSKATTSVEDVLATNKLVTLTKDEQTIYKELSTLSQKIRSLDESYYCGATDIISDEEYDALA
eukprot:scaffold3060_cov112-Skeletonema_dohrnii-CCMP3373.AAC.1